MSKLAPITVVIPCYRCDQTIARAITSVLEQTMLPSEIILIDDFSNDDGKTRKVLLDLQNKYYMYDIKIIFSTQNGGPSLARNLGWQNATQPYIAFLDADDSWHAEKLKIQYSWMKAHPQIQITAHESAQVFKKNQRDVNHNPQVIKLSKKKFYFHNPVSLRSVMLRRSMSYRFNSRFRKGTEDYLLWFEMILDGVEIFLIKSILSFSYKNDYGDSGLNGNIWTSHQGVLDVYKHLFLERKISYVTYLFSYFFSTLLLIKRVVTTNLRKIEKVF